MVLVDTITATAVHSYNVNIYILVLAQGFDAQLMRDAPFYAFFFGGTSRHAFLFWNRCSLMLGIVELTVIWFSCHIFREGYELWCYFFRTYTPSMPDELNFFLRYVFSMPYRMLLVIHPLEYPPTKHSSSRFQIFLKRRTSWNMRLDHGKFLLHCSKGLEGGQHQTTSHVFLLTINFHTSITNVP
jgi:hypothetical protein